MAELSPPQARIQAPSEAPGLQRPVAGQRDVAEALVADAAGSLALGPAGAGLVAQATRLNASPAILGLVAQRARLNASPAGARLAAHADRLSSKGTIQRRIGEGADQHGGGASETRTGLPGQLKAGLEAMSGFAMDDVRVHYNAPGPAQLQAHAYTQGSEIHVAPGQERHLAHEAWHVVQQKQGRVRPTMQLKGVGVNDDAALEREADIMGARLEAMPRGAPGPLAVGTAIPSGTVQAKFKMGGVYFDYDRSLASLNTALDKLAKDSFVQTNRAAILAQIKAWSESEQEEGNATSYKVLIARARSAVAAEMLGKNPMADFRSADLLPLEDDIASDTESEAESDQEIEVLGGLRRTASITMGGLAEFRDRSKTAHITSSDTGTRYAIAGTSNFMTGGGSGSGLPDDYREIIVRLKALYGTDQKVARMLLAVLDGGKLPGPPADWLAEKFRSLVFAPEMRRAAINPVAAHAALLRVAERGGDLFDELRRGALFVASEKEPGLGTGQGGSARSQFHRNSKVDITKPDFRRTARREKRNLERAARRFGMEDDPKAYIEMRSKAMSATWRTLYGSPQEQKDSADGEDDLLPGEQGMKKVKVEDESEPVNMPREETAPSGNCLYEGVNIALGNPADMDGVLRQFATAWLLDHPDFAQETGIDADRIVAMLSQNGAWAGDAGDLAPYILASAIRRNIIVHTPMATYLIEAAAPEADAVELYLHGAHYTVQPPEGVMFSDAISRIKGPGV